MAPVNPKLFDKPCFWLTLKEQAGDGIRRDGNDEFVQLLGNRGRRATRTAKPVMGLPAVSCSRRQWRMAIMSGVFSRRIATTTGDGCSPADYILLQKLLSSASRSIHIQAQEVTILRDVW